MFNNEFQKEISLAELMTNGMINAKCIHQNHVTIIHVRN